MHVTESFQLRRPDLESCRVEAMLSLFIAERCSINTCDNLKDIVINCHTKKEVSYSYFAQNVE